MYLFNLRASATIWMGYFVESLNWNGSAFTYGICHRLWRFQGLSCCDEWRGILVCIQDGTISLYLIIYNEVFYILFCIIITRFFYLFTRDGTQKHGSGGFCDMLWFVYRRLLFLLCNTFRAWLACCEFRSSNNNWQLLLDEIAILRSNIIGYRNFHWPLWSRFAILG